MGYLVCENCGSYYKLQEGASLDDYLDTCECGGKLHYQRSIHQKMQKCPRCGFEGEIAKLRDYGTGEIFTCPNCKDNFAVYEKCPFCRYDKLNIEPLPPESTGVSYKCPKCGNSFGNLQVKYSATHDLFLIHRVLYFIVILVLAILIIKKQFFP